MEPLLSSPATQIGAGVAALFGILVYLRRFLMQWKADGLEATKIDASTELVNELREQLKELSAERKEVREECRRLQDYIDANREQWREERKQLHEKITLITEQWQEERRQWADERERLSVQIDTLTQKVEELKSQYDWDGRERRGK